MLVALLVVLTAVAGLPLTAVMLVTVACRQEETARSMAGRAPGGLAHAARRLLGFKAVGITKPMSRGKANELATDFEQLLMAGTRPLG